MRKAVTLAVLGTILTLAWSDAGSACGRRRARLCQPVGPCYLLPLPLAPTPAAAGWEFISPAGNTYRMSHTGEFFASREAPLQGVAALAAAARPVTDDEFTGKERKAAKLSIADAPAETFKTVEDLLATLPADAKMLKHKPPISKAATSQRVPEEQRNVSVTAFLYAASRETDNDFHLIIGGAPDDPERLYMNVEISGLPPAGPAREALRVPRDAFKAFFGEHLPGAGYHRFEPPIPVRVSGSLFYDISHRPGVVGPSDHKPHSSWEIHPVTKIEFLEMQSSAAEPAGRAAGVLDLACGHPTVARRDLLRAAA
jgi:hypothetical protein